MPPFRHIFNLSPETPHEHLRVQVAGHRFRFWPTKYPPVVLNCYSIILFHTTTHLVHPSGMLQLPPNTVTIIPPGAAIEFSGDTKSILETWVRVVGAKVSPALREKKLAPFTPVTLSDPRLFENMVINIDRELGMPKPRDEIIEHLFDVMLCEIRRAAGQPPESSADRKLQSVRSIIDREFNRDLEIESLAGGIGLSRAYFIDQFSKRFGISPHRYLIRVRMEHARYLLEDRSLSIGEIARACGYTDRAHFSKAFKQYVGKSPQQTRDALCE